MHDITQYKFFCITGLDIQIRDVFVIGMKTVTQAATIAFLIAVIASQEFEPFLALGDRVAIAQ